MRGVAVYIRSTSPATSKGTNNMPKRKPTEIDIHVGKKLCRRRELLGLSQTEIGKRINISYQQIQKYEQGTTRISAGKLFEFGKILGVPVCYFFSGISDDQSEEHVHEYAKDDIETLIKDKHVVKLVRKYIALTKKNPKHIKTIHAIIDTLLENQKPD